jgi:hypothetical protein
MYITVYKYLCLFYVKKTIENCDKKRWLCMAGSEHGEHFYWLRFKKDLSLNTAVYATL